jgi:lipopolysaccharide export system permease protein
MTRLSLILIRYTTLEYLKRFLIFLAAFFVLLFFMRLAETLRVTASRNLSFFLIMKIAFNKSPYILQRITPLVSLFSTINTVINLNKKNEFVIIKSLGISIWQFTLPLIIMAFCIGTVFINLFSPIISTMHGLSQNYNKQHLGGSSNLLTLIPSNIWLKEESENEKKIIRAQYISNNGTILESVSIYILDHAMNFKYRIDADRAEIVNHNTLECKTGYKYTEGAPPTQFDKYSIKIQLSPERLQDGFSSPASIPFWDLPQFIKTLKNAGFSAKNHQLQFASILYIPIQMVIYTVIGIICSVGLIRNNKFYVKVFIGMIGGIIYFFLNEIIAEMSLSFTVSLYFTLAIPIIVATLILIYLLLHFEES